MYPINWKVVDGVSTERLHQMLEELDASSQAVETILKNLDSGESSLKYDELEDYRSKFQDVLEQNQHLKETIDAILKVRNITQ